MEKTLSTLLHPSLKMVATNLELGLIMNCFMDLVSYESRSSKRNYLQMGPLGFNLKKKNL